MKLDDAKARLLEKVRKEQEAKKKKEASKSESSWNMVNDKKDTEEEEAEDSGKNIYWLRFKQILPMFLLINGRSS